MSILEWIEEQIGGGGVSKSEFGRLIHSGSEAEVEKAMDALEKAGGYENLED